METSEFFKTASSSYIDLVMSNFCASVDFMNVVESIFSSTEENNNCLDIICYGIGSMLHSKTSQAQLSFISLLKTRLSNKLRTALIFDPILSSIDTLFLQKNDWNVISSNEEGKRKAESPTVFFMPHCPLALYNNVLKSNWNPSALSQLIIIGNSFDSYSMRYNH